MYTYAQEVNNLIGSIDEALKAYKTTTDQSRKKRLRAEYEGYVSELNDINTGIRASFEQAIAEDSAFEIAAKTAFLCPAGYEKRIMIGDEASKYTAYKDDNADCWVLGETAESVSEHGEPILIQGRYAIQIF